MLPEEMPLAPAGRLKVSVQPLSLRFRFEAVTSRARMRVKDTYLMRVTDSADGKVYLAECPLFRGLSAEDGPGYEDALHGMARALERGEALEGLPSSLRFAADCLRAQLRTATPGLLFPGPFTSGRSAISINGLVWMGSLEQMAARLEEKLAEGFRCIKIKIGGIDFHSELELLRSLRRRFGPAQVELRLDANGAFHPAEAPEKLRLLAPLHIHSIEQPIKAGQPEEMARLCRLSPIPVALDEELIGITPAPARAALLEQVRPAYIILKPALCGGLSGAARWIADARARGIGWWITSALESNVGLDAIAQFAATYPLEMPQGLGTGELYENNCPSPLRRSGPLLRREP